MQHGVGLRGLRNSARAREERARAGSQQSTVSAAEPARGANSTRKPTLQVSMSKHMSNNLLALTDISVCRMSHRV